jgi:hypothetical protein
MFEFISSHLIILSAILSFVIAQGAKVFIRALRGKKITYRDIFAYSDMPSGHTAVVVGLTTALALKEGFYSPLFAISFVFATIVIVDAIGLRNYLGQHGKTLNILVKDLKEDAFLDDSYPKLLERIGHTPLQVIIGGILGASVSLIAYLIF